MQQTRDPRFIRLQPLHEILFETPHAVAEEPDAVEEIPDEHRFVDIEFELAVHARDADGLVVAHDLRANHCQRLALRRVDLARHNGTPRLVFGELEFAQSAPWSGA